MSSFDAYKREALQNPEVKAEYDALKPEFDRIQAIIDSGDEKDTTHKKEDQKCDI